MISIIVPVYNLENYIEDTVRSLLAQTYRDIEIIAVDDGSTDRSYEKLCALAEGDDRIKVIRKENGGVSSARIEGIRNAKGEWIAFCDGDDHVEPEMYGRLLANALENGADISHCGYKMIFPDREYLYRGTGEKAVSSSSDALCDLIEGVKTEPGLCIKLFGKKLFDRFLSEVDFDFSVKNYEDLMMNYYLFSYADKVVYEDICPYHYMVRKNSAATGVSVNKISDPIKVLEIIIADSDGRAKEVAYNRYAAKLIDGSSMLCGRSSPLYEIKTESKAKLKKLIGEGKTKDLPLKTRVTARFCSACPEIYGMIHLIYLKITGKDKMFDV